MNRVQGYMEVFVLPSGGTTLHHVISVEHRVLLRSSVSFLGVLLVMLVCDIFDLFGNYVIVSAKKGLALSEALTWIGHSGQDSLQSRGDVVQALIYRTDEFLLICSNERRDLLARGIRLLLQLLLFPFKRS